MRGPIVGGNQVMLLSWRYPELAILGRHNRFSFFPYSRPYISEQDALRLLCLIPFELLLIVTGLKHKSLF